MSALLSGLSPRRGFALVFLGAAGSVGFSLWLVEAYRLNPCPMCIFQRLVLMVLAVLAVPGLLWPAARRLWGSLLGLTALGGLGVAGYQSWMQAYPHLARECGYSDPTLLERIVDDLGMRWPDLFLATGFCTSKEWELLGLSLANLAVILFSGIAAFALWLGWRRGGR